MKVLIVYDTKHGNTKKVAEEIGEGLKSVESNEVTIENVKEIDLNKDEVYDLILIGSPNHVGSHTKSVKKFIKGLPNSLLKGKSFAVFDTYMSKDYEKAVKKMEKQINELMPTLNKASSGLSIKVGGMKGPIVEEDLPKCKEFGITLSK
ncbi:MAG: flavodoxin domain-containing protein [Candidatus Lokiarchaeota archaeon]|nr:flavodoxin domain-containing protein [Candidatus Lokiarchaeota archaeon]